MMYTVECRAGRLVEARLVSLKSIDEVATFEAAMRAAFEGVRGKSIVCADWRQAHLFAPDVADRLRALLMRGNPHLELSAVLLARAQATFNLQVERVVREAGNPARRTFREPADVAAFLTPALSPAERLRLDQFLGERVG